MRRIEREAGGGIFDGTIQETEWTDEDEIRRGRYGPCKGRSVKGLNLLNAGHHRAEVAIAVAFEVRRKPIHKVRRLPGKSSEPAWSLKMS
jgi:hypothetical protein